MTPCGCQVSDREDAECRATAAAAAEREHMAAERVAPEHLLHQARQTVEAAPHVGRAGRKPDPHARRRTDHASSAAASRATEAMSGIGIGIAPARWTVEGLAGYAVVIAACISVS
jgi:hypothetical protein